MMSQVEYFCKGDWLLGTACGTCTKCKISARDCIEELRKIKANMRYMVMYSERNYGTSVTDFDTRVEADEFLFSRIGHYDGARLEEEASDYELIEMTQEFDVATAVIKHQEKRKATREAALMKLTEEEKVVLGLTKA